MTTYVVYDLVAADGEVIYVGATSNIELRIRQHGRKSWWPDVAAVNAESYETRDEMLDAESERIRELSPRHNINSGGSRIRAEQSLNRHADMPLAELLADPNFDRKAQIVAELFT